MTTTLAIPAAPTALAVPFTAIANAQAMPASKRTFDCLDRNRDNRLQSGEHMPASQRRFMEMDANGDGTVFSAFGAAEADASGGVTIDEARAYHARRRK